MVMDPALPEIDETLLATTRYLQALTVLDDESLAAPSVLPGWSRAHVVAHVSRNADAFAGVLASAGAGEPAAMYTAQEVRDLDIEETVRRYDRGALLADAHASADRFAKQARGYDGAPDATYTRTRRADDTESFPVTTVGPRRRAEVEIHHADLDLGYEPSGWPPDFSTGMVAKRQQELTALADACPSMVLCATDVDAVWPVGVGPGPEIHGTAGDLAYWLVGRGGGRRLTCTSGELPALGRWR